MATHELIENERRQYRAQCVPFIIAQESRKKTLKRQHLGSKRVCNCNRVRVEYGVSSGPPQAPPEAIPAERKFFGGFLGQFW